VKHVSWRGGAVAVVAVVVAVVGCASDGDERYPYPKSVVCGQADRTLTNIYSSVFSASELDDAIGAIPGDALLCEPGGRGATYFCDNDLERCISTFSQDLLIRCYPEQTEKLIEELGGIQGRPVRDQLEGNVFCDAPRGVEVANRAPAPTPVGGYEEGSLALEAPTAVPTSTPTAAPEPTATVEGCLSSAVATSSQADSGECVGLSMWPHEGFGFVSLDAQRGGRCLASPGWGLQRVPDAVFYRAIVRSPDRVEEAVILIEGTNLYSNLVSDDAFFFDGYDATGLESTNEIVGGLIGFSSAIEGCIDIAETLTQKYESARNEAFVTPTLIDVSYYLWVSPEVPANNAAIEIETTQLAERCEYVVWWSFPASETAPVVTEYSSNGMRRIEVDPSTLDGTLPATDDIDTSNFRPYTSQDRIAVARDTGRREAPCAAVAYILSQRSHIELVDRPMTLRCQLVADPTQQIAIEPQDWPGSGEISCHWSEN